MVTVVEARRQAAVAVAAMVAARVADMDEASSSKSVLDQWDCLRRSCSCYLLARPRRWHTTRRWFQAEHMTARSCYSQIALR